MSVFRNQNGERWTARFRWRTGGKQYSIRQIVKFKLNILVDRKTHKGL